MEEGELIWEPPEAGSPSASTSPLGRVMHTLLGCRPRHLRVAISKLGPSPSRSSSGALLDESLCFLWRHAEDAAKKEEPLDQILIPIIEHVIKFEEPKYRKQVFILIRWLCGNELLCQAILSNLTEIIMKKKDHFIAFGWCIFVRSLVELSVNQVFDEGNQGHHITLLKILCRSIPCVLSIICEGSTLVDGFELPTRLSMAAADCTLVLTEALANKAVNSEAASSERLLPDSKSKSKLVKLQPLSECEMECNQTHVINVSKNLETEFLLWNHLDELIILVEKLQADVQLSYSQNEKVHASAASALVSVLKHHNENFNVIEMLLDTLSVLSQYPRFSQNPGSTGNSVQGKSTQLQSGSKLDIDNVLKLTPKWSENVKNWGTLIGQLIEKLFLNPSHAVLIRFMSYLSEQLAEAEDVVLHRVLLNMRGQDLDERWISDRSCASFASEDASTLRTSLFNCLCPLLIVKLIPLKIFDNLESPTLYGELCSQENLTDQGDVYMPNHDSIAALLFNRAFGLFEYEDVRKLAAELCGRLHPQVLLPVVGYHLDSASQCRDTLKLKACLFSICTSLMARGKDSARHPSIAGIRKVIDLVLSWPSVDGDEVSKAQHGCIDCLALMICVEVQSSESWIHSPKDSTLREARGHPGSGAITSSVLTYVIQRLASDEKGIAISEPYMYAHYKVSPLQERLPLTNDASTRFRLCMANVLISACQKVASSGCYVLANRIIPSLISSVESMVDSDVRAACLQVLFSAVYHLKSSVLPFSSDLLKLSIKALKKGSEKEKIAAAKLLASLMASDDDIVESISMGLLEANLVLASISVTDSSRELRQLCEKLLACVTSSPDNVFPGT